MDLDGAKKTEANAKALSLKRFTMLLTDSKMSDLIKGKNNTPNSGRVIKGDKWAFNVDVYKRKKKFIIKH